MSKEKTEINLKLDIITQNQILITIATLQEFQQN